MKRKDEYEIREKKEDLLVKEAEALYNREQEYYTLEEFLKIDFGDGIYKCELIDGIVCIQGNPTVKHEEIITMIMMKIASFLEGKPCRVFSSNIGYMVKRNWQKNEKKPIDICFKPDLSIVCNANIIRKDGIYGTPNMIVEVLSTGTKSKDLGFKFRLYEEIGVREYWIIDPDNDRVEIYKLNSQNNYLLSKQCSLFEEIEIDTLKGFKLKIDKAELERRTNTD